MPDDDISADQSVPVGELGTRMGISIEEVSADRVTGSMPVAGNRQPFGLLHGGANATLAETLGSVHAHLRRPDGHIPVGIELSCSHHRAATDGDVHAESVPINVGRTLGTFAISIRDDRDRLVCTARLTCFYRAV